MSRKILILVVSLLAPLCGCDGGGGSSMVAQRAYPVERSWYKLPFANGYGAGVYDATEHKVVGFRSPMFAKVDQSTDTRDFCYDLFFGVRKGQGVGAGKWLHTVTEEEMSYVAGTGIVHTVQRAFGARFDCYYFSPMSPATATRSLVAIVRAVNEGPALSDVALYALLNFRAGGRNQQNVMEFAWRRGADEFTEGGHNGTSGEKTRIVYKGIGTVTRAGAGGGPGGTPAPTHGADNPYELLQSGLPLTDKPAVNDTHNDQDIVCGFESAVAAGGTFATNDEAWFGVVIALNEDGQAGEDPLRNAVSSWVTSRTPKQVLDAEIAWWASYHTGAKETPPANISAADLALYQQSTAVLKMAQVRGGSGHGQLLASLPPGGWNIGWVRDGCYAIAALIASGHTQEAREALQFFMNGTANHYHATGHVPVPYKISICRYFGDGKEETDSNASGPNVEFDGFGLFLWALDLYVKRTGDTQILSGTQWGTVWSEIADPLAGALIDRQNGLIIKDSSIWERHWDPPNPPDGRKQFTYTSICAVSGLRAAASLATGLGEAARAATYTSSASAIFQAIETNLLVSGALGSAYEDVHTGLGLRYALDGSNVEAINLGLYTADSPTGAATLAAFDKWLRPATWANYTPGYRRSDDWRDYNPPNSYDLREWVFVDLRMANAYAQSTVGKGPARVLLDWIRTQAEANYNLIPELFTEQYIRYEGNIPMVGFGAGAWVLALHEYYR
ncbi:glycoside hydrolase family 15 protein [Planctomycetota bacterium]